jgi:hypothetical protein
VRGKVVLLPDGIQWLLQEDRREEIHIFHPEAVQLKIEEVQPLLNLLLLSIQEDQLEEEEQQIHNLNPQR